MVSMAGHRKTCLSAVLAAVSLAGCFPDHPTGNNEAAALLQPRPSVSAATSTEPITGLDFPGNSPDASKAIRFQFADPHLRGLPIYGPGGNGVTYIWRVYPREQITNLDTYYTTFFWGNDGTFTWNGGHADTYYGAHPYPRQPNPNPGNVHDWEIAVEEMDIVQQHPLGVVDWDRWYTQAFVAWVDHATGRKMHRFYWDLDTPDANHTVDHATQSSSGNVNPPKPTLAWGDAPWSPGREMMDGVLRGIQIYNSRLSLAEIQTEVANPLSTTAGSGSIWYLNLNPTPTDISDKSGRGNHPAWVGTQRPALYSQGTDATAPSMPTAVTATAASATQINLSWTASTDNVGVAGYRVYRGGTVVATVSGPTTYQDVGLAPSTSYSYKVQAFDAAGNASAQSASASATTPGGDLPSATNGLIGHWPMNEGAGATVADASGRSFHGTLTNGPTWSAGKVGGALSFDGVNDKVDLGTAFDIPALPFTIAAWVNPVDFNYFRPILSKRNSYALSGMRFQFDLDSGTGRVRLLNSVASGTEFSFTPALKVWTHLAVVARSGATQLYVNGVLRETRATTFVLGAASGARAAIGDLGGEPGENFSGRIDDVRVYNRALDAAELQSLPGLGGSGGDAVPPTVPTNLASTVASSSQINLSWSASTDNVGVTGYRVYRGGVLIATVSTGTTYQDKGLAPPTTYTYAVRAFDAAGNSSTQSTSVSATTARDDVAPTVPTNLTAKSVSATQIDLSWSASSDNVAVAGYKVFRGGVQIATVTSGRTYRSSGLAPATTYSFAVLAYDAAGNQSAQSTRASATTWSASTTSLPTNGLIAYWPFDEGAGGSAADASGGGFNGKLVNGPAWGSGKIGGALSFDGVNDRVDLGTAFNIAAVPFTIAVWVRPTGYDYFRAILSKRDAYAFAGMRFQFDLEDGTGRVRLLNSRASGSTFDYSPPLNVWTHLTVVARSGATDLYVNGVLRQRLAKVFVLGSATGAKAAIGDLGGEFGEVFSGSIDELRVYKRGLTAEEIASFR
jgi:chitodextrinase